MIISEQLVHRMRNFAPSCHKTLVRIRLRMKIALTAVQYVSGNELVSLDHLSSSS